MKVTVFQFIKNNALVNAVMSLLIFTRMQNYKNIFNKLHKKEENCCESNKILVKYHKMCIKTSFYFVALVFIEDGHLQVVLYLLDVFVFYDAFDWQYLENIKYKNCVAKNRHIKSLSPKAE